MSSTQSPNCGEKDCEHNNYHCPESIPQPKFPSPNSSFPPNELAEIKECIEEANQLLLSLVSDEESELNVRSLQKSLRRLIGLDVEVMTDCEKRIEKLSGVLVDVGKDFIIVKTNVLNLLLVPFTRMLQLTRQCDKEQTNNELELINMDSCFKRDLTLHFGKIVSNSPFLINRFFGLDLYLYLDSFTGCFLYVKTDQAEREIEGRLLRTTKDSLVLLIDKEKIGIDFDEICTLEIEQEALARIYK